MLTLTLTLHAQSFETATQAVQNMGIGWNLGVGIALAFTYILFLRFSQMFVYAGTMPASIALWIPNLVFALITVFLYTKAQK